MSEFTTLIMGNISTAMFCALFFLAHIGMAINLLLDANNRDQNSVDTPVKFRIGFLIQDNWKRILLAELLIYVAIRFAQMIFAIEVGGNSELYLVSAVLIGFGFDKLGEFLKKKFDALKTRV